MLIGSDFDQPAHEIANTAKDTRRNAVCVDGLLVLALNKDCCRLWPIAGYRYRTYCCHSVATIRLCSARLRPTDMCSATKTGFHNLAMKRSDDQYVGAAQEVVAADDG